MVRSLAVAVSLVVVSSLFAEGERPISNMRVGIASPTESGSMTGAGSGDGFLVVWTSRDRGGQAMRFDSAGRRLGETSIGLPLSPRLVFAKDDGWTVVSDDGWVRVDRDGVLLDHEMHPFPQPFGRILGGAWTGNALVLATYTSDRKLMAYSLDAVMNPAGSRVLLGMANSSIDVRVASDGDTAVIVYNETSLMAALFDANGAFVKSKSISSDPDVLAAVGSNGNGYLVMRYRAASGMTPASYGALFLDRNLKAEEAPTLLGHRGATLTHAPTLSWDGSAYTFFYLSPTELRAARIGANGQRLEDAAVSETHWSAFEPLDGMRGVSGGGTTLFLYAKTPIQHGNAFLHVRAGHAPDDLGDAEETALEVGALRQDFPAAASGSTMSFVVWREQTGATTPLRVYGTRVARDGTILDPQSIAIANDICGACAPAVASNGETFLVAWITSTNRVLAALYDAKGVQQRFWLVDEPYAKFGIVKGEPVVFVRGQSYVIAFSYRDEWYFARQSSGYFFSWPTWSGSTHLPVYAAGNGNGISLLAWGNRATPFNDTYPGAVQTFGGDRVSGAWWNGTMFSVLHGDDKTFNVTRFQPKGTLVATVTAFERPQSPLWGETVDPACDAAGCTLAFGAIEDGRFVIRPLRVDDDGTLVSHRYGNAVAVPRGHLAGGETMEIAPMQVPGGTLAAAYTRRALEPPTAGMLRVYLKTLEGVRARTVRH